MTQVDCQGLTWRGSIVTHVGEPVQSFWATQESDVELLGNCQGTHFEGPQTCFGCQWLTWVGND
eukprot:10170853-Karenia_brevis.AAC.1